jgi:hypothetical protein
MKHIWYFLKWNFNFQEWQPYSKRMLGYFILGIVFGMLVENGFFITPILIFVDMTVDIVRNRYNDFLAERDEILDELKKK